jgi:dolichol-phosphate mannosyltransferase
MELHCTTTSSRNGKTAAKGPPCFSVVIPIHNEQANVNELLNEIREVLTPVGPFEVILVDDSSTDDGYALAAWWKVCHRARWLRILRLRSRVGQSGAVLAGAEAAEADIICMMDGDMQNDPRDLIGMLRLLKENPSLAGVSGIRADRRDGFVRRVSSKIGNFVRNLLTGDQVQDSACGIKAFRKPYVLRVPRFNGMHRFMPTLVRCGGGRVQEVVVEHRQRANGTAKYGIGNRALRGLKDCFAVRWYRSRALNYQIKEEC